MNSKYRSDKYFKEKSHLINYSNKLVRDSGIEDNQLKEKISEVLVKLWNPNLFGIYENLEVGNLFSKAVYEIKVGLADSEEDESTYKVEDLILLYESLLNELNIVLESESFDNMKEMFYDSTLYRLLNKSDIHGVVSRLNIGFSVIEELVSYMSLYNEELSKLEKKSGVYFLYRDEGSRIPVYVGRSVNLGDRISSSARDHSCSYFSFIETETKSDACLLEMYYITTLKPIYNKDSVYGDKCTIKLEGYNEGAPSLETYKLAEVEFTKKTRKF